MANIYSEIGMRREKKIKIHDAILMNNEATLLGLVVDDIETT